MLVRSMTGLRPSGRIKAIHCLGYQCCEGDVPQRDLYKALDLVGKEISDLIVKALPEYGDEPWNLPDGESPAMPESQGLSDLGAMALA